jgi:co-chaperonin GroES (HSP10)
MERLLYPRIFKETTMETFPIRPLFDRVIVREIPIEDYYEKSSLISDDLLNDSRIKERSDRGVVVAAGKAVQEVQVGDTVQFDEYCMSDPIYLNPADKNKIDLPRYWQIREPDLKGVRLTQSVTVSYPTEDGIKAAIGYMANA